jgi:hypothetical protein
MKTKKKYKKYEHGGWHVGDEVKSMLPANFGMQSRAQVGNYNPWTGIDASGATGGFDQFGNAQVASIPGGGALSGGAAIAGGVADLIANKKNRERQQGFLDTANKDVASSRKNLDENQLTVTQAQRDLATAGIRPTDMTPLQSIQATELNALGSDPRALMGGIGASTTRAQQGVAAAQQTDLKQELGAMGRLANLEQSYADQNTANQRGLLMGDNTRALGAQTQATANIEQLRADKQAAWGNIAGGALDVGMAFAGAQQGGRIKYEQGGQMPEELLQRIMQENKGQPPVQKTEGEFNHDTNKKAIVDEETGEKEGEATGGEYILNPEQGEAIKSQYDTIAQMIDNGDEPTLEELQNLYDAVHEVFSQPQFNEA